MKVKKIIGQQTNYESITEKVVLRMFVSILENFSE